MYSKACLSGVLLYSADRIQTGIVAIFACPFLLTLHSFTKTYFLINSWHVQAQASTEIPQLLFPCNLHHQDTLGQGFSKLSWKPPWWLRKEPLKWQSDKCQGHSSFRVEQDIHETSEEWQRAKHLMVACYCLVTWSIPWLGSQCLMLQDSACLGEGSSITVRMGRHQEFSFPRVFCFFFPKLKKKTKQNRPPHISEFLFFPSPHISKYIKYDNFMSNQVIHNTFYVLKCIKWF